MDIVAPDQPIPPALPPGQIKSVSARGRADGQQPPKKKKAGPGQQPQQQQQQASADGQKKKKKKKQAGQGGQGGQGPHHGDKFMPAMFHPQLMFNSQPWTNPMMNPMMMMPGFVPQTTYMTKNPNGGKHGAVLRKSDGGKDAKQELPVAETKGDVVTDPYSAKDLSLALQTDVTVDVHDLKQPETCPVLLQSDTAFGRVEGGAYVFKEILVNRTPEKQDAVVHVTRAFFMPATKGFAIQNELPMLVNDHNRLRVTFNVPLGHEGFLETWVVLELEELHGHASLGHWVSLKYRLARHVTATVFQNPNAPPRTPSKKASTVSAKKPLQPANKESVRRVEAAQSMNHETPKDNAAAELLLLATADAPPSIPPSSASAADAPVSSSSASAEAPPPPPPPPSNPAEKTIEQIQEEQHEAERVRTEAWQQEYERRQQKEAAEKAAAEAKKLEIAEARRKREQEWAQSVAATARPVQKTVVNVSSPPASLH